MEAGRSDQLVESIGEESDEQQPVREDSKCDDEEGGAGEMTEDRAYFDILDSVEEPFDDFPIYFSSDESSEETSKNDSFSDEDDATATTCDKNGDGDGDGDEEVAATANNVASSSFDMEIERVFDKLDECPSDCEESMVAERADTRQENPLPAGWKEVYHESGATIFVHLETNVCSLSRPYFVGTGSTKLHYLPQTAIPCLNYSLSKGGDDGRPKEATSDPVDANEDENADQNDEMSPEMMAKAKQEEIVDYCKRLFRFKKIKFLKFRSWDVRRKYLRTLRNERNRRKCPFSNNKFITCPIQVKDDDGNVVATKKWIINPRGKSYVAILHEYLQQSLKSQPVYTFSEVDNAKTPYAATVVVNGNEYGSGVGMSKKDAKVEAAKATLLVLLPKMKRYILSVCEKNKKCDESDDDDEQNVASLFDDIDILDPRITRLSQQTTEPKPYELLSKCLRKKGDTQEVKFDFQVESKECTMSVGEHKVTIRCDNKRDGKHEAAQALLQLMHPYINNWGSLLRLYSNQAADQYLVGSRQVNGGSGGGSSGGGATAGGSGGGGGGGSGSCGDREMEEMRSRAPDANLLDTLRQRMLNLRSETENKMSRGSPSPSSPSSTPASASSSSSSCTPSPS